MTMARGWESKSIESQQDDARREPGRPEGPREATATDRKRTLELARAEVVRRLERAPAGAARQSLELAIVDLEQQIAACVTPR
jgi:hypothetical protein